MSEEGIPQTKEYQLKLFRVGQHQAIRIPREFELPGDAVVMRQENGRLILEPVKRQALFEWLALQEPIDEEFPEINDPPPEPFDL